MIRTVTPVFSIVAALLIFFFYTKPMFAEISVLQGEEKQYAEAALKAKERNDALKVKLEQKRSYTPETTERLSALVPQNIDEVAVLADLTEMARRHNMLFGNISVSKFDDDSGSSGANPTTQTVDYLDIESRGIEFSLIGTYEQFKSFLADVERSLVMMEIVSIKFDSGEGMLQQYRVMIKLFALPPL